MLKKISFDITGNINITFLNINNITKYLYFAELKLLIIIVFYQELIQHKLIFS